MKNTETEEPYFQWHSYDRGELIYVSPEHGQAIKFSGDESYYCEYCSEDPREGGSCERYVTDEYRTFIHNLTVIVALAAAAQQALKDENEQN